MKKKQAEQILIKAGDTALKIGLEPPQVDCRVVAEDYYQRMIKKIEQRDELLKMLKMAHTIVEILINHIPTGKMRNILTEENIEILSLIEKTENRCKHNIKMLSATIGFCKKCDENINLLNK